MKFLVLIPARFESTRFPGKPLAKICGEEMIVRVCRQVEKSGFPLAVATDNELIFQTVVNAGFQAVMTSSNHKSGTDRIEEAYRNLSLNADVIINVQGDEPFIDPYQIKNLASVFQKSDSARIATVVRPFDKSLGISALEDPNLVKVVRSEEGRALYFSRSVVPYLRNVEKEKQLDSFTFYTHVGIYAYKADVLSQIVKLPQSSLEIAESLEQLRWLQAGYAIDTIISNQQTIGIDTPADLLLAEDFMRKSDNF